MSGSAWSHWQPGTIEGHADELAILEEHAPDASMAEPCMSDGLPAVLGYESGRLVACSASRGAVWGAGRVEVRVDGPSATIMQGPCVATYVPVPFALAAQTLSADHGS